VVRISDEQRRARLGLRHCLATPAPDPVEATQAMLALHSSDPVTVFLSTRGRVAGFEVADLERALYEDRSLFRFYGMRRTLWVVDRETVRLVHHSSTRSIGERERRRSIKLIEDFGVAEDGAKWLETVEPQVLGVIRERGELLARDLTAELPQLAEKITFYNKAGRVMGTTGMTSRTLNQLALESRVIRTRPAGTWISGQYRWAEMEGWLGGPILDMSVDEASDRLVIAWLRAYGPASETDLKWWTGWPLRQLRGALDRVGVIEVEMDTGTGVALPDDLEPVDPPRPWVALLPSLDPTTMGWKERGWYVGEHESLLFDRNGNAGPTVWSDGRVVGAWAQRKTGEIVYEMLSDLGSERAQLVEEAAAELETWLGGFRVTPRFRSPLDKRLAG